MYEFVEGVIEHANPAFVVINVNGIGYHLQISINTFEKIKGLKQVRILTHLSVKEDSHSLYGFIDDDERQLFRHLIMVNGVGTNTARMILSAQSTGSIISAISTGNLNMLKSVKGVGPKTAQRIIIELQDKIHKIRAVDEHGAPVALVSSPSSEALLALQALGFARNNAEKAIQSVTNQHGQISVEELIKFALKIL